MIVALTFLVPHTSSMLDKVEQLVEQFFATVPNPEERFYNEASLQHQLALFLQRELPENWRLHFERPASHFRPGATGLTKKEIDLAVTDASSDQVVAIELKCPRQGQHPEQMFKACQDLRFLEELVEAGFAGGVFAMHVHDPLFYEGASPTGIYRHFRGSVPICGEIPKPTGPVTGKVSVLIRGSYTPRWTISKGHHRYWIQAVRPLGYPTSQ